MLDHTQPAGVVTWLTYRVADASASAAPARLVLTDGERALLRRLVEGGALRDGWSEFLQRYLLEQFAAFQARAELDGQWPGADAGLAGLLAQALRVPEAALARAAVLSDRAPRRRAAEVEQRLAQFAAGADGRWIGRRHLARYYNVLARTAQLQGRPQVAAEALARWRALRPDGPDPTGRSGANGNGRTTTFPAARTPTLPPPPG